MALAKILTDRNEKTASAAGWIAHNIGGFGFDHFHHQPNDVARRAKLAVLPSRRDLSKHVLVNVTLSVTVLAG